MKYTMEDLAFIKNGNAPQHKTSEPMTGKICVIAGASSGVGLEAAKKLAAGGARLLLVCRNQGKAERVKTLLKQEYQNDAELVIADFARLDDVRAAAQEIAGRIDHIDVLINSAGLHSTKRRFTGDGNELVFQVNHLASFLFTMLLLNLVKNSEQGRIIQVNSEGHRFGGLKLNDLDWKKRPYLGLLAYGASKTAQLMTVATLAKQLEDTRVTVNAMHPGGVRTSIGSNNGWLYRAWLRGVIWHFLKDPEISGDALYYLAAAPELRNTTGRYFNLTIDEKPMPHALDEAVRDEIWEVSHRLTGL
jgi:NAD(P)-dependent dehydrogenase (short-subunit alcohol dehydrogenase family)